jgi:hypothetical protein
MEKDKDEEQPFACNIGALSKEERVRYKELTKKLINSKQAIEEIADGYALRFTADSQSIRDTAEFITYERLCCPFFDFDLSVEKNNGSLWLKIRGREGVKDFIKGEFGI